MPFRTTYDLTHRLFVITPDGDCDFADGVRVLRDLVADPGLSDCVGILADMRRLTYTASHDEVQAFADYVARLGSRPFAVVVASQLHRGVSNQLAAHANLRGGRVAVFADVAAAEAWLASGGPVD